VVQSLGIHENEELYVYPLTQGSDNLPTASQVFLEPVTMNDWEIVELNAQYLEDQLVNQIAVLRQNLVLPIWIKQRIKVLFKVGMSL
jgi:peroxin-1